MRTLTCIIFVTCVFGINLSSLGSGAQTDVAVTIPAGKLAFVTSKGFGYSGKICYMAGQHRTTTVAYRTREIEWLPDGNRIIYSADDAGTNGVFIYDLTQHTSLPLLTNTVNAEAPAWSPDGRKIAYVKYSDGRKSSQIYTANVDGSNEKPLTEGQYYNWTPRWSPDGQKLVFETTRNDNAATHRPGGYRDVYVMDSDGQNQINLTTNTFGHHPA